MICDLCKKEINEKFDRYVHVEDWNAGEMVKDVWCHLSCFNKGMDRELTALQKQAKQMLHRAGGIFDSKQFNDIFPNKDKEYVIS